jgi:pimeloyl-ACP methyl ester carboxylesterase
MLAAMEAVERWRARGEHVELRGRSIFVIDHDPARADADPVLVLHGYPSCSFDWRHVIDRIGERRRVVLLDMLGYGLSEKPLDHAFSLFEQADIVTDLLTAFGLRRVALLTHDMGNSVGGELLARTLGDGLELDIGTRVLTNGSIYMDLVRLSDGQRLLLSLPDEALSAEDAPSEELFAPALASTFAPDGRPSDEELRAQWHLVAHNEGNRILHRLIRYVEERRVHEARWTGAIERHASPLSVVWGTLDPIAVVAMGERLCARRPDAVFTPLAGIGHYPMIEAPGPFADAVIEGLDRVPTN